MATSSVPSLAKLMRMCVHAHTCLHVHVHVGMYVHVYYLWEGLAWERGYSFLGQLWK